uniref:ABC transporter ATP-binding protein n=1 Tax=Candidatus Electronema sp. TaxID=2698783 RepID=UPI00405774E3
MSDTVIQIEGLWKEYRLGVIGHGTLTRDLQSWWARVRGKEDPNSKIQPILAGQEKQIEGDRFWALRDINLEVKEGEILGIIGRNGAGKSTLLKLLSRVTAPTKGQIKIKGRIASLLEVGTGFHPELTGRENIFMNGAILGMSKQEIKSKLDEIINFSGVEKFIDTPVKRYSSGMYVRLAFAVAAHLEPEILVVDEVLAVGDAEFQKKCLGKMEEVSKEGRTVLFVSHNMGAIRKLCSQATVFLNGQITLNSDVYSAVEKYLASDRATDSSQSEIFWAEGQEPSTDEISLRSIRVLEDGTVRPVYNIEKNIDIEIIFTLHKYISGMRIVMSLLTADGTIAFSSTNHSDMEKEELNSGKYLVSCRIPFFLLNKDRYYVKIHIGIPGVKVLLKGKEYLSFYVDGIVGSGSFLDEKWLGAVAPRLEWTLRKY